MASTSVDCMTTTDMSWLKNEFPSLFIVRVLTLCLAQLHDLVKYNQISAQMIVKKYICTNDPFISASLSIVNIRVLALT